MPDQLPPLLVAIKDAQRLVPIGRTKMYALIKDGTLKTVKVGRRTFVKMSSIRELAGDGA